MGRKRKFDVSISGYCSKGELSNQADGALLTHFPTRVLRTPTTRPLTLHHPIS